MRRVLSNLTITCFALTASVGLTGCQSMNAQQKPPCSCGQLHGAVHQPTQTTVAASHRAGHSHHTAKPAVNHVAQHTAPAVDHSACSNGKCLHASAARPQVSHLHAANSHATKHAQQKNNHSQPTTVCQHCQHTGTHAQRHAAESILIRAQNPQATPNTTPRATQNQVVRSRQTTPAPRKFVVKPTPTMSSARLHKVATDQPMVQISPSNQNRVRPVNYTVQASQTQSNWTARQ